VPELDLRSGGTQDLAAASVVKESHPAQREDAAHAKLSEWQQPI
jgi:hypothetical protein